MDITMMVPRAQADKRLAGFNKLVVGALIGFALMYVYLQAILIKQITMPLPIFSVISLVLAALVAGRPVGGWRWAPLLAVVWSVFLSLGKLDLVLMVHSAQYVSRPYLYTSGGMHLTFVYSLLARIS
jgi:hypothetical protein